MSRIVTPHVKFLYGVTSLFLKQNVKNLQMADFAIFGI